MLTRSVLTLFILGLLLACQSVIVERKTNSQVDLVTQNTYAWTDEIPIQQSTQIIDSDKVDRVIRQAVESELTAQGLSKATNATAELLVRYYAAIQSKIKIEEILPYYRDDPFTNTPGGVDYTKAPDLTLPRVQEYDQGTLVIDIADAKNGRVLWRSKAEAVVDYQASDEKREQRINRAVQRMLKGLTGGK